MGFEDRKQPLTIYSPEPDRVKKLLNLSYHSSSFEIVYKDAFREDGKVKDLLETDEFKIVSVPVEHTVPSVAFALLEKDKFKIDKNKLRSFELPPQATIYGELKRKGKAVFKGREINLSDICLVQKGKKIVYSGDTKICDSLIKIAQDADILIQDCTYFDEGNFEEYGHASIKDVLKLLKKIKVKRVILTHISRRYKNLRNLKQKVKNYPNLEIARDFMKITI